MPGRHEPTSTSTVQTITATGTGQARVLPKNRHSNASIAAAVDAVRKASIGGALMEAHKTNGPYGPGPYAAIGPFGPGQYCGTVRQVVGRPVKGQKPKLKKVHRCFVPRFASISLTVTYSAS